MNKIIIISLFIFFIPFHSFGNEIIGKSIKCERQKPTIRGYPFYFYFENSTEVQSYFLSDREIKIRKLEYEKSGTNIFKIRYIGTIFIDDLILKHTKYNREYVCSYLYSKRDISEELKNYKNS